MVEPSIQKTSTSKTSDRVQSYVQLVMTKVGTPIYIRKQPKQKDDRRQVYDEVCAVLTLLDIKHRAMTAYRICVLT